MDELHQEDDANVVMELEDAPDAFAMEEVDSDNEPEPMDEITMNKLRKLHEPRESRVRHGVVSVCMKQFALLAKMDPKRLMDDPSNELKYYAHECNHCKTCTNVPWKFKGNAHKFPIGGGRSYHAPCAQRHLSSNVCNEDR